MKLIKNNQSHVVKGGVLLKHPGEDAFCNHFDFCVRRNPGVKSHSISDGLAHRFLKEIRHTVRRCAGCDAAWLQHQYFLLL